MVSIIVPIYNDPYAVKTINSLLENSSQKIEIIPVFDGCDVPKNIPNDKRIKFIKFSKNLGMRAAINAGISKAKGKYIMKCDSHCAFAPNFDTVLTENTAENWLTIPRRYSLNEELWQRQEDKEIRDYHYLTFPIEDKNYGICINNIGYWPERAKARKDSIYDIDDTMTFQGSCWFANKKYFLKRVGFLDDNNDRYGTFAEEPQEIGLKYWLGGGENKIVKKTWYAHLFKRPHHYQTGLFERNYKVDNDAIRARTWSAKHWLNNEEPNMIHKFSWLVEKFWPVRTWPEDRSLWKFPEN